MSSPSAPAGTTAREIALRTRGFSLWYDTFQALFDVDLDVKEKTVTSMIGPSGCGKSTLLRSMNRIVERLGYVQTKGLIEIQGQDVLDPRVSIQQLRRNIGMVFQRPNPLPLSIRDNILFGHRLHDGSHVSMSEEEKGGIVEAALSQVLLWDTVKDRLRGSALSLSLEEQQKLCIARLLPTSPSVLLMDEPCSALDPRGTAAVEELLWILKERYTILIVTHNMAQARRVSEECVFMLMGKVVEHRRTAQMFLNPSDSRTADYIEGRYG